MLTAVDFIAAVASEYHASAEHASTDCVILKFNLALSDGRTVAYEIEATHVGGNKVAAKERVPVNLPKFCPHRHINIDGTFCLYWWEVSNLDVCDNDSAHAWWRTLWKFLVLQYRAKKIRRWPNNNEWAHGPKAALEQHRAESAARALGAKYELALRERRLSIVSTKRVMKLYENNAYLYSVWRDSKKVVKLKQRCICDSSGGKVPKRLRRCGTHAADASILAFSLHLWAIREEEFWSEIKDFPCCGSCDNCRLKTA
ncbi:E2 domain-containing protein [Pseudacidovorax sp. NFM-22]|uniref:E2 domain-containing protein n=1 Tax=Pseudacidovorax sp. NFM-22 TaxID=2744469 RepID=UPI001F18E366|nr:E2 domain-containing protein [Pseudacidovorax sp. NFM-22]